MPFTLSHAVVAPPIAYYTRLPLAGLMIGCMVPDLSRLLVSSQQIKFTILAHTWQGIIYPDLWIGLFFSTLWYMLYRPVFYYYLKLDDPLNINSLKTCIIFSIRLILAIIIGTATHIIWDGLTHLDFRTFAFHQFLAQKVSMFGQIYPMHYILQIGSSIIALPFLCYALWRYYQTYHTESILTSIDKILASIYFTVPIICASYQSYQFYLNHQKLNMYDLIGRTFNIFSFTFLITLTLFSLMILIIRYFQAD